jgi:hypothetical protein
MEDTIEGSSRCDIPQEHNSIAPTSDIEISGAPLIEVITA